MDNKIIIIGFLIIIIISMLKFLFIVTIAMLTCGSTFDHLKLRYNSYNQNINF